VLSIEGVTEKQLAGVHPQRPLVHQHLDVLTDVTRPALSLDRQHVAFDVNIDRGRLDTGDVEMHHELIALAVGVHRNRRRTRPGPRAEVTEYLLAQPVQLTKWVSPHQHHAPTPSMPFAAPRADNADLLTRCDLGGEVPPDASKIHETCSPQCRNRLDGVSKLGTASFVTRGDQVHPLERHRDEPKRATSGMANTALASR
jgi:hypothetical protein